MRRRNGSGLDRHLVVSFSTPHLPNPLGQFFQVSHIHPSDKLLSVDVVDGKDVVLVEDDLVPLLQPV